MAQYTRLPSVTRLATEQWPTRSFSLLGGFPHELGEGLIEQEKSHVSTQPGEMWRSIYRVTPRRYGVLGGSAVLIVLLFAWSLFNKIRRGVPDVLERNAQTLHLTIPTPDVDSGLCKTVLSATALQYSTPTVVRYDSHGQDARANAQSRMIAVRDYLATLANDHGNDTAILLDGTNIWFQLRPEVLVKRSYDLNRRANNRLADSIGREIMRGDPIQQSVVFSAASECGAAAHHASGCSDVPEPPLQARALRSKLPRHLSQDLVMGKVTDILAIYRQAVAIIEQDAGFTSELAVLSEIFHKQEHNRALLSSEAMSWSQRFRGWLMGKYSHKPLAGRHSMEHSQDFADDFGIGLDYAGELSIEISKGSNSFALMQHHDLPADVAHSMPPFWTPTGEGLHSHKTWSDLGMFTNTHTHAIPAMVHSNATGPGVTGQSLWHKLWLQPFSRTLLDAYMSLPAMPLASAVDSKGVEQVFWSTTIGEKAGVKDTDGTWYVWEDICKGDDLAQEIFGDGLGEWIPERT